MRREVAIIWSYIFVVNHKLQMENAFNSKDVVWLRFLYFCIFQSQLFLSSNCLTRASCQRKLSQQSRCMFFSPALFRIFPRPTFLFKFSHQSRWDQHLLALWWPSEIPFELWRYNLSYLAIPSELWQYNLRFEDTFWVMAIQSEVWGYILSYGIQSNIWIGKHLSFDNNGTFHTVWMSEQ